jgi:hypothetical protein
MTPAEYSADSRFRASELWRPEKYHMTGAHEKIQGLLAAIRCCRPASILIICCPRPPPQRKLDCQIAALGVSDSTLPATLPGFSYSCPKQLSAVVERPPCDLAPVAGHRIALGKTSVTTELGILEALTIRLHRHGLRGKHLPPWNLVDLADEWAPSTRSLSQLPGPPTGPVELTQTSPIGSAAHRTGIRHAYSSPAERTR